MPSIHEDILTYLSQQRQMFGNVLYADTSAVAPVDLASLPAEAPVAQPPIQQEYMPMPVTDVWTSAGSLSELNNGINTCMNCALGSTRNSFVFGSGNENADLMVVGEAPGADEDEQGLPFVGRAGQLLTKILDSVQFSREDVYICNILKCRPPNNRKPLVHETDECEPYLHKQIALIKPKVILALGLTAANTLLKNKESMSALRSRTHMYRDIPMLVTYHPAALLRNPEWKKHTWEDVQKLRSMIDTL